MTAPTYDIPPSERVLPVLAAVLAPITGSSLTVITPVDPDPASLASLTALLHEIGDHLDTETVVRLRDLRLVHFLRWVILPPASPGAAHLLAFGSDFDGSRAEHLLELWRVSGPGLVKIYAHCAGGGSLRTAEDLSRYFEEHHLDAAAAYSGTRDRSAQQIQAEEELQGAVADFLDTPQGQKAAEKNPLVAVKGFAKTWRDPRIDVTKPPWSAPTTLSKVLHGFAFWPIALVAIAILGVPGLLFAAAVELCELIEPKSAGADGEPDPSTLTALKAREDHFVQNQLTHLVAIKPGWFRMMSLRIVLAAIGFLAKNYFDRGDLGKIPSIHYARWMILKKERRLLFFSNFDGSWESYLGDFIDQAARGLTGIWSNTVGFPPASFLLFRGARDEENFKNWTRRHQIETQVWYTAYPQLSVQNVNTNTLLRGGLSRDPEGKALDEWQRVL